MECSNINRFRPHYFMTDIREGCIKSIFSYIINSNDNISLVPLNSLRYLVVFISHIIYCTATDIESEKFRVDIFYALKFVYYYTIFSTLTAPSNTEMMSLT